MAVFKFQLHALLRHRKNQEQEKQRALMDVQKQFLDLQTELRQMNDSVTQVSRDVRDNKMVGALDLAYLAAHRRYSVAMQRKAMTLVQRMALVQKRVEEAQKDLGAAAVQRKIVEKLRDKQFERWKAELDKKDVAEMDEIGMQLAYENLKILEPHLTQMNADERG